MYVFLFLYVFLKIETYSDYKWAPLTPTLPFFPSPGSSMGTLRKPAHFIHCFQVLSHFFVFLTLKSKLVLFLHEFKSLWISYPKKNPFALNHKEREKQFKWVIHHNDSNWENLQSTLSKYHLERWFLMFKIIIIMLSMYCLLRFRVSDKKQLNSSLCIEICLENHCVWTWLLFSWSVTRTWSHHFKRTPTL